MSEANGDSKAGGNGFEALQRIDAAVQHYAWGMVGGGKNGLVARMSMAHEEPGKPYAELWMGTHKNAPSKIKADEVGSATKNLSAFLEENPEFSGSKDAKAGSQLPFLFKCLSVRCPLSIQAHPDKM
jgi:mannose-6-phosphate isomerase